MKKIHRLSSSVIAKIAAGEVIERPAFAVKELIENAIDAKATVIEIQIEESGLKRLTVIDNGEGMSKEDLEICFLPHTTSKIKMDDDLNHIKTFGFRGEALASIASFSHMTIITRTQKDIGGSVIQIKGGIVEDSAPIGAPIGTIVTAEGLFYSVPARKKFLKSAQTEFRHITEMVGHFALIYPSVHFILKHNKKTIIDFPPSETTTDRIRILMGPSLTDDLLPLSFQDNHMTITGHIGKPQIALKQNQKQFIFINNRHVNDKVISLAMKEAFGTLLPSSHTPVFLLHITIPHEHVDVNVHPRKEQVTFINPKSVFDTVKLGVTKLLADNNITFQMAKFRQDTSAKTGDTNSAGGTFLKSSILPWNRSDTIIKATGETLVQINQVYILTQTEDSIIMIDQHGAHERILYETLLQSFNEHKKQIFSLTTPVILHLSLTEQQIFQEYHNEFEQLGFSVTEQAGNTLLVAVPVVYKGRNYEKIISDMLIDLKENHLSGAPDRGTQRMIAFLACRAAVKAGDILSKKEMKDMIKKLHETPNPETCPHGRPTTLTIPLGELDKNFRR